MNAMQTILAVALASCCLYAEQSQPMVILSNGSTQVVWRIDDPDVSINENVAWFSAAVCSQELAWLTSRFPAFRCAR